MSKLLLAGAAAIALCAGGAMTTFVAAQPMAASSMPTPSPSDFVMMAGQSDSFETQSSQLAATNAKSSRVKAFAKMMIKDHGKTTAAVIKAATMSGMNPPPAPPPLNPDQQQMMSDLQGKMGPDFDRTYMQQQVMAHQQALQLHSTYAKTGSDPNLMKAAKSAVPIVTHHLQEAQSISSGMGAM